MNSSQKIVENRSASEKKLRSTSSSFNPSFVVTNRTKNFKKYIFTHAAILLQLITRQKDPVMCMN